MLPIKGIVICVGYDDLLKITLPLNARHFTEVVVVSDLKDDKTRAIIDQVPNVRLHRTDIFYNKGARFNKGAAMEEGLDILGRNGWIIIWDADILFPNVLEFPTLSRDTLYGAPRRILNDPTKWHPELNWYSSGIDKSYDPGYPGYFQMFNGEAPVLKSSPWYDPTFTHAGGSDAFFANKFRKKHRLLMEVLHLGPRDSNWFGRTTKRIDGIEITEASERLEEMENFKAFKGWNGRRKKVLDFKERI